MADRGPGRVGPVWVWSLGLLIVLAGVVLLARWTLRRDGGMVEADTPAAEEMAGAADRARAIEDVERASVPVGLEAITPLGPAHTGIQARFSGTVVGGSVPGGLWVRTTDGPVAFVRVVDLGEDAFTTGDSIAGRGIVRYDPAAVGDWVRQARLDATERSGIISEYYLETTLDRLERR